MNAKILLAEDDESLGFVIKDNLELKGYEIVHRKDGASALEAFLANQFDLCLLDVMMPIKDGFALATEIRKLNKHVPIIFLTAKAMEEDKVKGFKTGADDYITKPFSQQELYLRIEAVLKRTQNSSPQNDQKDIFQIASYQFDCRNLQLKHKKGLKTLTKKEAELLRLLCIHKEEVLQRDMALRVVWGEDDYFLGRSMDVFITKLRKYLSFDDSIKIINVHGVGFRLTTEENE